MSSIKAYSLAFVMFLGAVLPFASCRRSSGEKPRQALYFHGLPHKTVLLSRVVKTKDKQKRLVPLRQIETNTHTLLPVGEYLLSNTCSSYAFTQQKNIPTEVNLSHLQVKLWEGDVNTVDGETNVVPSLCHNALTQKEQSYRDKTDFDILPGDNRIFISGKYFQFHVLPQALENFLLELVPVSLVSTGAPVESQNFFVIPRNESRRVVTSVPLNGRIWLYPNPYVIEINGTKMPLDAISHTEFRISLGILRVEPPPRFPFAERVRMGGQPIAAFLESKVLVRLGVNYPVFPGKYTLNLDGSALEKQIDITENQMTVVKTVGAQIQPPKCSGTPHQCYTPSRITLHQDRQPFILMLVPVGLPFLVFAGNNYQYGVEGVKGIFKNLPVSSDSVQSEALGLARLKWEVRYVSAAVSTEFVRFESRGSSLYGKSVDLSFFKPAEVFLPQGFYWLTYFVGDSAGQNTPKIRTEIDLSAGDTKDIVIPLYVRGDPSRQKDGDAKPTPSQTESAGAVLTPLKQH